MFGFYRATLCWLARYMLSMFVRPSVTERFSVKTAKRRSIVAQPTPPGNPGTRFQVKQEGLAVASIARDVVVEMTPPRDNNAR